MLADETIYPHLALSRELAERLVEHYDDDPDVTSVPDALRQAARDVLDDG